MSASVVAMSALYLFGRARARRRALLVALGAIVVTSAPWWVQVVADRQATRIVRVADREQTTLGHLREVVPRLYEPMGGVLGTHVPVVADSEDFVLRSPGPIAAGLILIYGGLLILAARRAVAHLPAALLLATAALGLIAFALPVRSAPHTIRFLTPIYLPVAALAAWAFVAAGRPRRSLVAVLALA